MYPLHVNKFVRRSSIGMPVRPQSPLQRSGQGEETIMHTPRPYRTLPPIMTGPEDPHLTRSQRGGYMSPMAHLQGTRRRCDRHGRHDHIRQDMTTSKKRQYGGTKDLLTKSRSGVYIPTGYTERRQMEATSPWIRPMSPIGQGTGIDVLTEDADACRDCLQELDIRRREVYQGSGAAVEDGRYLGYPPTQRVVDGRAHTLKRTAASSSSRYLYAPASHAHSREPSVVRDPERLIRPVGPVNVRRNMVYDDLGAGRGYDPAWHATPYQPVRASTGERRSHKSSTTTMTTTTEGMDDLVVSKPLSDGLNAVVVEHQGHLRRVVLNTSNHDSEVERLQRLSREIASVANAIARASASKREEPSRENMQYSLVLDQAQTPSPMRPEAETPRPANRTSSIPELLTLIDQTASEIRLNSHESENAGPSDQYVGNRRQSLVDTLGRGQSLIHSDEVSGMLFNLPSRGEQAAHRQELTDVMRRVDERMSAKAERPVVKPAADDGETGGDAADALGLEMTATPPPRRLSKTAAEKTNDESTSTALATARKSVPTVIATAPAALAAETPASGEPTFKTPPVEMPADPTKAGESEPAGNDPLAATTPATATPRAGDQFSQPQTHSYFPNFLTFNPFHRWTPNPSSDDANHDSDNPVPSISQSNPPPAIATQASPYHHAPTAPLDLYFAQHEDPGVKQRKDVVRAAMRMEREGRRARRESAAAVVRKGVDWGRKGWFG